MLFPSALRPRLALAVRRDEDHGQQHEDDRIGHRGEYHQDDHGVKDGIILKRGVLSEGDDLGPSLKLESPLSGSRKPDFMRF